MLGSTAETDCRKLLQNPKRTTSPIFYIGVPPYRNAVLKEQKKTYLLNTDKSHRFK